jgi:hypothetical protein
VHHNRAKIAEITQENVERQVSLVHWEDSWEVAEDADQEYREYYPQVLPAWMARCRVEGTKTPMPKPQRS